MDPTRLTDDHAVAGGQAERDSRVNALITSHWIPDGSGPLLADATIGGRLRTVAAEVPDRVVSEAEVQLTSGVPFVSDKDLEAALDEAQVRPSVADAIVDENADARIDGLRAALAVLALFSVLAFVAARRLPKVQPGDPRFAEALVATD